ncbi:LysE family translocator [Bradyrhizobium sp. 18BD]
MPTAATLFAFVIAVLAMQLVPGPETLLVMSRGIGEGRRVALWTVIGMTLVAGAIQLPLLALGIASAVRAWPWAHYVIRFAGAAYLIWLGVRLLVARPERAAFDATGVSRLSALREGLITNMTNPSPLIFMLAFLPQFVGGSVTAQLLLLGAIQKATGFGVLAAAALSSGSVGAWIARRRSLIVWQKRFTGIAMMAFGISLAFRAR